MAFKMRKHPALIGVVKELRGAVKAHGKQADVIEKHIEEMNSPAKYAEDPDNKKEVRRENKQTRRLRRLRRLEAKGKTSTKRYAKLKEKTYAPFNKKLKPCQKSAARKKFDVYPSAYANMWASRHKC